MANEQNIIKLVSELRIFSEMVQVKKKETESDFFVEIKETVCMTVKIQPFRVETMSRKKEVIEAKHLIAYFLFVCSEITFVEIADKLGYKDHSIINHAINKVMDYKKFDNEYNRKFMYIKHNLEIYLNKMLDNDIRRKEKTFNLRRLCGNLRIN